MFFWNSCFHYNMTHKCPTGSWVIITHEKLSLKLHPNEHSRMLIKHFLFFLKLMKISKSKKLSNNNVISICCTVRIFLCYNCRPDNNTFWYNFHIVACVQVATWGVKWQISILPQNFVQFWLFLLIYEQNPSRHEL